MALRAAAPLSTPTSGATPDLEVAVIGAGPHGLSATTHHAPSGCAGAAVRRPDGLLEDRCPKG